MTESGRQESAVEELQRCDEELQAAERLLEVGLSRVALTRVYFAVFHAIRGLLFAEDLAPRSHQGVHHLFNVHFVRTGRFSPADARVAVRLQKYREEADYAESFVVDAEGAREELDAARELVDRIRQVLTAGAT